MTLRPPPDRAGRRLPALEKVVRFFDTAAIVSAAIGAIVSFVGLLVSVFFWLGWGFVALYATATVGLIALTKWRIKRHREGRLLV